MKNKFHKFCSKLHDFSIDPKNFKSVIEHIFSVESLHHLRQNSSRSTEFRENILTDGKSVNEDSKSFRMADQRNPLPAKKRKLASLKSGQMETSQKTKSSTSENRGV